MGSFKKAFAEAKEGSTFDWNGRSYKKEYAKPDAKPTAKPTAKPDAKSSRERHDRLVAQERKLAASRPKPEASTPKRSGICEGMAIAARGEEARKAAEREAMRNPREKIASGLGEVAKAVTGNDAAKLYVSSLAGRRRPYTEEDFSPETADQLRSAARQLRVDSKKGLTDIDKENRGRLKRGFGQLDYAHYGKDNNVNLHSLDTKHTAANSIGRARVDYDAKGNPTKVTDRYGFDNKNRRPTLERYDRLADTAEAATRFTPIPGKLARGVAKAGAIAYDFGSDLLNQGKPSRTDPKRKATWNDTKDNFLANVGTAVMGKEEVPITYNLNKEDKKAGGGAVKKYAKGGSIDGCCSKGKTKGRFV